MSGGAWVKIGRVKRSDLPPHLRKKLPKGRQYQLAALIVSDSDVTPLEPHYDLMGDQQNR